MVLLILDLALDIKYQRSSFGKTPLQIFEELLHWVDKTMPAELLTKE
jgi:hypothetical protein